METRDMSKEALSRACIHMGTVLPRGASAATRAKLVALQTKVEAVLATDTAALAHLASEVEAMERTLAKA